MSRRRRIRSRPTTLSLFAFQDIVTCVIGIMLLIALLLGVKLIERTQSSPSHRTTELIAQLGAELSRLDEQIAELDRAVQDQLIVFESGALSSASALQKQLTDVDDQCAQVATELSSLAEQEATFRQQRADLELLRKDRTDEKEGIVRLAGHISELRQQLKDLTERNRVIYNAPVGHGKQPWLVELNDANSIVAAVLGKREPAKSFTSLGQFETWALDQAATRVSYMLLVKPQSAREFNAVLTRLRDAGFSVGFDLLASDQIAIDLEKGASLL